MEGPRGLIHIQRTAQVMTTDSDLWVVPRYEKLHLINILALQQQLSSLEGRIQGAAKCEYQRHKPQDCSSSCAVPNDVLLELQTTIKAFGKPINLSQDAPLIHYFKTTPSWHLQPLRKLKSLLHTYSAA